MTKGKKIVFRIGLLATPVLLLVCLELGLRAAGWFSIEPVFIEDNVSGENIYRVNENLARRYFEPEGAPLPTLYSQSFAQTKSENAVRIFCLGGSTTAGFPYDAQVPFPQQLDGMLREAYPSQDIEMLNLGISAMNSFTARDLLPEILETDPDMIIIYMGHNEIYGVFGTGSTFSPSQSGMLTRLYLKLLKFNTFQMIHSFMPGASPAQGIDFNSTLMEQSIGRAGVDPEGAVYTYALKNFSDNLESILRTCLERGVRVLLGTLTSNLRDLPPLGEMEGEKSAAHQQALDKADKLLQEGDFDGARMVYAQILESHPEDAASWYKLGRIYLELNNEADATACLHRAKDADRLPFRAGEIFNQVINIVARNEGAILVDVKGRFESHSPMGVPGNNLFCDHLHPNPYGYFEMANCFFDAINKHGLIKAQPVKKKVPSYKNYTTHLDWDIGGLRIHKLMSRWPFTREKRILNYEDYQPYGDPYATRAAYDYLFKHHDWVKAHYRLADHYLRAELYDQALREYRAVAAALPRSSDPLTRMANVYKLKKDWARTELAYREASRLSPENGMLHYQLAISLWEQQKLAEAIEAMAVAAKASQLEQSDQLNARYYLAGFYADSGDTAAARTELERILAIEPGYKAARAFLSRINTARM